jgi:predicted secreted protein
MKAAWLALCCMLCSATIAAADTEQRYNQVSLQSRQSETVSNDTMHVTLDASAEAANSTRVAERINQDMEWALAAAGEFEQVKVSTANYQTWPVYRKNTLQGWRGHQSLMLESQDTEALSRLTARLQEQLQVKSMNFTVSDDRRVAIENRLIAAALDAFKERARIVGDNLQAKGYRIVELNVGTTAQRPPVVYQARMAATAMESDPAVAVESGESDIQVIVNGTVELIMP